MKGDILLNPRQGSRRGLTVTLVLIAVTVALLACASQTSAFNVQSVFSSDINAIATSSFTTNQNVYATVTYTSTGTKTLDIYITTSIPANNGNLAAVSVAGPTTVTYSETALTKLAWNAPTTAGTYYIILDENRNGNYNPTNGDSASTSFTVSTLMVTPEYTWGGLVALLTCFAAFAVFAKRNNINPLKKTVI